mgnify:CR=1 FL=1
MQSSEIQSSFRIMKERYRIMKIIATEKAPAAIGPYSQGIIAGDFFFASGQIAIIPETGEIAEADS